MLRTTYIWFYLIENVFYFQDFGDSIKEQCDANILL